jgi:hypothetical protein
MTPRPMARPRGAPGQDALPGPRGRAAGAAGHPAARRACGADAGGRVGSAGPRPGPPHAAGRRGRGARRGRRAPRQRAPEPLGVRRGARGLFHRPRGAARGRGAHQRHGSVRPAAVKSLNRRPSLHFVWDLAIGLGTRNITLGPLKRLDRRRLGHSRAMDASGGRGRGRRSESLIT